MQSAYNRVYTYLWTSLVAQMVKCLSTMWETGFDPWVRKIPWRRKWQSTPVLLPGKSHGHRSLVGYSPWGRKELDMTERLHSHIPTYKLSKNQLSLIFGIFFSKYCLFNYIFKINCWQLVTPRKI